LRSAAGAEEAACFTASAEEPALPGHNALNAMRHDVAGDAVASA